MDFRGFDSSIVLIQRGGIPRPMGDFPESLSQARLVGILLEGRLGVSFVFRVFVRCVSFVCVICLYCLVL